MNYKTYEEVLEIFKGVNCIGIENIIFVTHKDSNKEAAKYVGFGAIGGAVAAFSQGILEGIDSKQKSNITGFITVPDTDFNTINTPNEKVEFVELIGATDAELLALKDNKITVKELYEKLGTDVTSYNRNSVV